MKIYSLIVSDGDEGHLEWYKSEELVQFLLSSENPNSGDYYLNKEQPAATLDLPLIPDEHLEAIGIQLSDDAMLDYIREENIKFEKAKNDKS